MSTSNWSEKKFAIDDKFQEESDVHHPIITLHYVAVSLLQQWSEELPLTKIGSLIGPLFFFFIKIDNKFILFY